MCQSTVLFIVKSISDWPKPEVRWKWFVSFRYKPSKDTSVGLTLTLIIFKFAWWGGSDGEDWWNLKKFNSLLHHVSSPIVFRFRKHVKKGHVYPSGHTTWWQLYCVTVTIERVIESQSICLRVPCPWLICLALFVLHGCHSIFALCGCTSARSTSVFICGLMVWPVRRMSSCGYQIFSPWANPSIVRRNPMIEERMWNHAGKYFK